MAAREASSPTSVNTRKVFPIVGVGASAGGLTAFKEFLRGLRKETPAAYVLIQHMDPKHESMLVELLSRESVLPIEQVGQALAVQPGHIYVIKPDSEIFMSNGCLQIEKSAKNSRQRLPVDVFFRSLAEDQAEMAVGVVLSGTGSDGALGLKAIKAKGGMTLAQDPEEAEFNGMPKNAVNSHSIDFVARAGDMARYIDRFFNHRKRDGVASAPEQEEGQQNLLRILSLIRSRTGHDFRHYKRNTIVRRVFRRMGLHQIEDLEQYLEKLRTESEEVAELAQDLLISVTAFFRDRELWDLVADEIVPQILADKEDDDDTIRAWVPGCATGEEAYTIAILIFEALEQHDRRDKVQVYATDIDERARETARRGIYPESIAHDVGERRLRKFFKAHDDHHYQVSKQLRDCLVFAEQNLISDPPFSRLDLVSCRNLLIYLSSQTQDRVIPLLHFSLRPAAYLILGNAESIGKHSDLFSVVSKQWRIYRREGYANAPALELPTGPRPHFDAGPSRRERGGEDNHQQILYQTILEHHTVASALVDNQMRVLYLEGNTDAYLQQAPGVPSADLISMARDPYKARLRQTLKHSLGQRQLSRAEVSVPDEEGERHRVAITCRPVKLSRTSDAEGATVVFEDLPPIRLSPEVESTDAADRERTIASLEDELRETREELQATIEDQETSNEELKASNEEVMSMNEELQSSNEELETSKEELQSLNEELTTLNSQLEEKIRELENTNNDLQNLLRSINIGVLFISEDYKVQRFTKKITDIFKIIHSDLGRPLEDLNSTIDSESLLQECGAVLDDLKQREEEIQDSRGRWFLQRILPYRTDDNRIEGVVVTFFDISELKAAEARVRESEESWRRLFQDAQVFVMLHEGAEHAIVFQNRAHSELTGRSGLEGRTLMRAFPELEGQGIVEHYDRVYQTGEAALLNEFTVKFPWGDSEEEETRFFSLVIQPWYGGQGEIAGVMTLATEITETVRAKRETERMLRMFRATGENIPYGVWWCDAEGKCIYVSQSFRDFTGKSLEQIQEFGWMDLLPPEDVPSTQEKWLKTVSEGKDWEHEHRFRTPEGNYRTILSLGSPVLDDDGAVEAWVGLNLDITGRKEMEQRLREGTHRLSLALESAKMGTHEYNPATGKVHWDDRLYEIFGVSRERAVDIDFFYELVHPEDRQAVRDAVSHAFNPVAPAKYDCEYRIKPADGSPERWVRATGEAIFDEHGQPVRFIGTAQDITVGKAYEAELAQTRRAAEAANEAKSAFLANMSHDIRTPLTTIQGYTEILQETLGEKDQEIAKEISNASERLMITLNSVLNLARLESGETEIALERACLNDELRQVVQLFSNRAPMEKLDLDCHLPPQEVFAHIEKGAFNRVISNLIDNAINYTPKGGRIDVSLRTEDDRAIIEVSDTGQGIREEFQEQLFEPFTQERERHARSLSGSGLGTAIAKQLVALLKGDISVQSEVGKGSRFTVSLPLADDEGSIESGAVVVNADKSSPKLMVCDDHQTTLRMVGLQLRSFDATLVSSRKELFETLTPDFDVLLLDINLRGKNEGIEIMQELRQDPQFDALRIVAFTAHSLPEQGNEFLRLGFDAYLPKPYTREDLFNAILYRV